MTSLIPTHAAEQVADGVSEYLATSFSLTEKRTAEQLRSFLLSPETGMFNGPYVRTRLPYAPAEGWEGTLGWLPSWFKPYRHQAEAFKRLTSYADGEERRPEPTLVVTGTGSGKTESFLYPILDHCRRLKALGGHGGATGIKALILYPMNALAADQERRLATLITSNPELADVTAGIYTGENPGGKRTRVSENGLINDRSAMRSTPPDILLTNYKMLDQLLLRESDRSLWEKSARTLQYLALDEFHTYDSAQGTDVAMLLRRLGLMLKKYQGAGFLTRRRRRVRWGALPRWRRRRRWVKTRQVRIRSMRIQTTRRRAVSPPDPCSTSPSRSSASDSIRTQSWARPNSALTSGARRCRTWWGFHGHG